MANRLVPLTLDDVKLLKYAPRLPGGMPKIIHQCWWPITPGREMPQTWRDAYDEWSRLHPGWIHVLWTKSAAIELVQAYEPQLLATYLAFPYEIQRIDTIRYVFLKAFGGLYADLDMRPAITLDEHFSAGCETYLVRSGNVKASLTNCVMACRPGSPIMQGMIDTVGTSIPFYAVGKHLTVMYSTGPARLTQVADKATSTIALLPAARFCPVSVDNTDTVVDGAYINALQGSSWCGPDTQVLNWFNRYKYTLLILALIIFIAILFLLFYYRSLALA